MKWSVLNRQIHRWLAIIFSGTVLAIFVMLGVGIAPAQWVYFLPLPPLFLLMATGLTMFFQPYLRRAAKREAGA